MPVKNKIGWKSSLLSYLGQSCTKPLIRDLSEDQKRLRVFESLIRVPDTVLLDDAPYRLDAYENTFAQATPPHNAMSLVDFVIRAILEDKNVRIDAMLTFNLRDFGGICSEQEVELL